MATARLNETSRHRLNEAWEAHDPEAVGRYARSRRSRRSSGTDGLAGCARTLLRALPDFRFDVETQTEEGDTVVTRWTARGTSRGGPVEIAGLTTHRYSPGTAPTVTVLWNVGALAGPS